VLSQDQTLHKRKFDKAQILAGINFDVQNFVSYIIRNFYFINVLLFSFQGSFHYFSQEATLLLYPLSFLLSTTFPKIINRSTDNFYILSTYLSKVNTFSFRLLILFVVVTTFINLS
ncbi:hypothetical protein JOD29_003402, partial [Lysinibacillus composti]